MSDSFNFRGEQISLQESGDLPSTDFLTIVEELPLEYIYEMGIAPIDEGSAMVELAYDIASGANFKFNTMLMGNVAAADDIIKLGADEDDGGEACDVIVDDVRQNEEPGFRDGVISEAINEVVEAGSLYFSSAGNYRNGYKFTANWECSWELFEETTSDPCEGHGVASHVFNPDASGQDRYLLTLDGAQFGENSAIFLHWDDDEGTSRTVLFEVWVVDVDSEEELTLLDRVEAISTNIMPTLQNHAFIFGLQQSVGTATASLYLLGDNAEHDLYYLSISQFYSDLDDVEMRLLSTDYDIFSDFSDGSIFGHKCAASTITVAAFNRADISGADGEFADPEEGSVAPYSSRGPCYVDSGNGVETRLKPVTTAATSLQTSTNPARFAVFSGTSAAAPVAAAIATIIRAACFPKVVTFDDMMEMLTNYDYTIDVTSDAGGEPEAWGAEAGNGIIFAKKMLSWVSANCQDSCSGAAESPESIPSPAPHAAPSTSPVTVPPTTPPTILPVALPTAYPTLQPSEPNLGSQTAPPTSPRSELTMPPTPSPLTPQSASSISPSTGDLADCSEKTTVTVTANGYDMRTSGHGCPPDGCKAANTRDGSFSTRWSCKKELTDGKNCQITYVFEEPQEIERILIAFYKGDERIRELKVRLDGTGQYIIQSSGETDSLESFQLDTGKAETLSLEAMGLDSEEWISLLEVQLIAI